MLIEGQETYIEWNKRNRVYYKSKGYTFTAYKDVFLIKVEDLSKGSNHPVRVECDYCGEIKNVSWSKYYNRVLNNKHTTKYACKNCAGKKTVESCKDKYGCHYNRTEEGKKKMKRTCIEKYGVTNVSQAHEFKKAKESTCKEKYGEKYYLGTKEYLKKENKKRLTKDIIKMILHDFYIEDMLISEITTKYKDYTSKTSISNIINNRAHKNIVTPYLESLECVK